jgi:hypothetical protein
MKVLILNIILLINGCAFYSMAGSIPSHIKSISIPLVDNETAEYGLEQIVTDKMLEKFNQEGPLKVLNKEIANSILKGTISKIDEGPYTYSKEESISEYRYEVFLKLEWYDVLNEVNLISKTYSGFGSYGLSGDISNDGIDNDNDGRIDESDDDEFGEPRSFAAGVAMNKIAEDILNDIMTTW